jgi:hypothetical protein
VRLKYCRFHNTPRMIVDGVKEVRGAEKKGSVPLPAQDESPGGLVLRGRGMQLRVNSASDADDRPGRTELNTIIGD